MSAGRVLRYLAPNVITASSMIFGLVSLWAATHDDIPLAAWMIIYAVLTDRLDGLVARAVKGTSELGMQLDSFADFLNFGIAPAYLVLTYLTSRPDLPYAAGNGHTLLFAACSAYMLCAVFRLARYNILADDQVPTKIFFGFPTTLSGGLLAIWMLVFLKYDPTVPNFGGAKLFGDLETPVAVWKWLPLGMAVGAYLMASRLPMPKVALTKNKIVSVVLLAFLALGYACGFAMRYPEICFMMPTIWSVSFLIWGQASASARAMYPPPLFPKGGAASEKPKLRPQEDLEDILIDTPPDPPAPS
jgi:CDP-diacylglycerol--serine O-phosphatidyltransferase